MAISKQSQRDLLEQTIWAGQLRHQKSENYEQPLEIVLENGFMAKVIKRGFDPRGADWAVVSKSLPSIILATFTSCSDAYVFCRQMRWHAG